MNHHTQVPSSTDADLLPLPFPLGKSCTLTGNCSIWLRQLFILCTRAKYGPLSEVSRRLRGSTPGTCTRRGGVKVFHSALMSLLALQLLQLFEAHWTGGEDVQEALEPHVATQQVPIRAGGQVEQQLLHQAAVLDLEGGHVRLGHNTGDLQQALHPSVHLRAAADVFITS